MVSEVEELGMRKGTSMEFSDTCLRCVITEFPNLLCNIHKFNRTEVVKKDHDRTVCQG